MPLAFFCTLFFRHRTKSVSAPRDGQSQSAPESARQSPTRGIFHSSGFSLRGKQGGFPLAPLHPLRAVVGGKPNGVKYSGRKAGGFPRGKQSARFALPCAPLVVCLNSGAPTAFGGCIHWIPASLRSPLHPFGAPQSNLAPHRAASPSPAPESARQSPPGQGGFPPIHHFPGTAGHLIPAFAARAST